MELMRDHFEGTELDMTKDAGAGPYQLPYRWRPLTWKVGEEEYLNERATSTQQTGFSFVAQSRSGMPNAIGGVLWFGLDDTYSTVYVPMYCGISRVPKSFAVGSGSFREFSWDSAFWVFNFVSNYSYLRYSDMIKDVQRVQREQEGQFLADQAGIEAAALALHKESPKLAIDYLTDYSVQAGDATVARWKKLGEFLVYKYLDGNVKDEHGKPKHPGYPEAWHKAVAESAGDRLRVRKLQSEQEAEAEKAKQAGEIAQGVVTLMKARGVTLDQPAVEKIEACKDLKILKDWLIRAADAENAEALFSAP
jgi:hypothetical protein